MAVRAAQNPAISDVLNQTRLAVLSEEHSLNTIAALHETIQRRMSTRRRQRRQRQQQQQHGGMDQGTSAGSPGRAQSQRSGGAALGKVVEGAAGQSSHRLLLVLGVISNPRTPNTRDWIRSTYMATALSTRAARSGRVLLRFVMGRRGLDANDQRRLAAEHSRHADLEYIDASDFGDRGGIFSCIDKLFAWFPHAVKAFPGAAFYAKADDDSYVDVRRLLRMLTPLRSVPHAYLGYVQYDSFITDEWKHCGWSAGPVGAVHGFKHGCPHGASPVQLARGASMGARAQRSYGPFPFVVGALTVMGGDLASWMRASPAIGDLVRAGRASQASSRHWDCGYSDVTLGYALAASNVSVSLVSVRDAMRDATYGAMDAKHFVISHHLRNKQQFEKAHAEATASAEWTPRIGRCVPWASVAEQPLGPDGRLACHHFREEPLVCRELRHFPCAQHWNICEVSAPPTTM
jgi:hypothetical protein